MICAIQRSGSFLLCEILKNTGLAGHPEEYFLYHPNGSNFEKSAWAQQHGVTDRREFIQLVKKSGTSANGVFGAKLMWNYFHEAIAALQELPEYRALAPHALLQAVFPNLHYIWIVRNDKVRQAVSWAIAAQTGIYAAWQAEVQPPIKTPVFDFEQIDLLHRLVLEGETGWASFFKANNITPMKVIYEEMVDAYEETGLRALDFLGVPYPDNLVFGLERKVKKQATAINELWAAEFRKIKRLEDQTTRSL